jgi:hypothetical protein
MVANGAEPRRTHAEEAQPRAPAEHLLIQTDTGETTCPGQQGYDEIPPTSSSGDPR